jgi:diketogulonate reductase-like aldo/keto reductase
LLHWRGQYPLSETVAAFAALKASGKILSWGVSNFDVADLEDAVAAGGEGEIACNQVLYHLQERAIEHAVLPWCKAHDVAIVGYSPFGHDDFPQPRSQGGRVLEEIAAAHGAAARQVALAFLVRGAPLFTIPKASNPAHAAENAGAGSLRLSEGEIARMDAAFPLRRSPRSLPML